MSCPQLPLTRAAHAQPTPSPDSGAHCLPLPPQTTARFPRPLRHPTHVVVKPRSTPISIALAPPSPQPPLSSPVEIVADRSVVSPSHLFLSLTPHPLPHRGRVVLLQHPLKALPALLELCPFPLSLTSHGERPLLPLSAPSFSPRSTNRHSWGSAELAEPLSSLDRLGSHVRHSLHDAVAYAVCLRWPRHGLTLPRCGCQRVSRGVPPVQPLAPYRDVPLRGA